MEKYNEKLKDLANRVKNSNQIIPLQQVSEASVKIKVDEVQLNVWMPKELLFSLKRKALDEQKSLKQIINDAVKKYLD